MTGKNQHILPRFLLKGFSSRVNKGEKYIWQFSKDKDPCEANITKVASEKNFYGKSSEDDYADKVITDIEIPFSDYIDKIRNIQTNNKLEVSILPEIFSHFFVRTRNFRDQFYISTDYLFSKILNFYNDPKNQIKFIEIILENKPEMIFNEISVIKDKYPILNNLPQELILRLIKENKNEMFLAITKEMSLFTNLFKIKFKNELPKIIKSSHNKFLANNSVPTNILKQLVNFEFQLLVVKDTQLILGDVVLLFKINGQRNYKGIPDSDEIEYIYLPISPTQLIIAYKNGKEIHEIDINELNQNIAGCSEKNYYSSLNNISMQSYASLLSINSYIISIKELDEITNELLINQFKTQQINCVP